MKLRRILPIAVGTAVIVAVGVELVLAHPWADADAAAQRVDVEMRVARIVGQAVRRRIGHY